MVRKATISDAKAIKDIVNENAEKGRMLQRALGEVYDHIRDFHVYEADGRVVGVSALSIGWEGLAEIRSIAVDGNYRGRGIGRKLVEACISDARSLGVREVFVLTYIEGFFESFGFKLASREDLPQKIWTECRNKCVKYPDECNEAAMTLKLSR